MKIHEQNEILKKQILIYRAGIDNLRRYLYLPKFNVDTSVNKQDIFNRLEDIQVDLNQLRGIYKRKRGDTMTTKTKKAIRIEIRHFDGEEEQKKAREFARANGLKEHNILDVQFKGRVPAGIYEIEEKHLFADQYNTAGKDGHQGYRVFEYCEKLSTQHRGNATRSKSGYYIFKGIEEIRELQARTKVCGYCGAQYVDSAQVWCDQCTGSEYLELDNLPLLYLVPVREKWEFDRDKVKVPAHLIEEMKARQKCMRKIRLDKEITKKKQDLDREVINAEKQRSAFLWLIEQDINYKNVIYYSHTDIFCFGWRNSIAEDKRADLHRILAGFPYTYEIK